ncbi:MAG: hypothetical protein R3C14_51265 [Caldilineaceae bacterium]
MNLSVLRKVKLWRLETKFVLLWIMAHGIVWPIGFVSALWISWHWLGWLIQHVPGEPRLSSGLYSNHEYIDLFLWSAFLLGGAIIGLSVGVVQWFVLRNWYKVVVWWIVGNVFAWSCGGVLLRLLLIIYDPASQSNLIIIIAPLAVGSFISGFWLESTLSKDRHQHRLLQSHNTIRAVDGKAATYLIIFVGTGVGSIMLLMIGIIGKWLL